jgi:hypothetical protein
MMHEQFANVRVQLHCTPVYKPCHTLVLGLFCNLSVDIKQIGIRLLNMF